MDEITFVDTTIRDGNQSLWGAMGMPTSAILEIAPAIERVGFEAVEIINSTLMSVAVRVHREDPWERIRLAAAAMPSTRLGFLTTGRRFVSWSRTPEAVMRLAYELLARNGVRRIWIVDPMNDLRAARRSAALARRAGAEQVVVGLVYSLSPVHSDGYYTAKAAELAGATEMDHLYLKDPGGLLTPDRLRTLLPAIASGLGDRGPVLRELHSHCNTGLAPLCYLEAVEYGVRALHCAAAPLANGTSQPSAEATAANLRQLGHQVRVDATALAEVAAHCRRVARRDGFPEGVPVEHDVGYYRHQLPGGMVSTLRRQLAELRLEERLPAVLDEVTQVRADLGQPIMMTPFSQFMGTQALLNTVGAERYASVPDELIRYLLGDFGEPPAPVDQDVKDRILALPRAAQLAREAEAAQEDDGEATLAELRRSLGPGVPDEELLLRAVLPGEDVDRLWRAGEPGQAPGPATLETPTGRALRDLLAGLRRRKEITSFVLRAGGCRVAVRRGPAGSGGDG